MKPIVIALLSCAAFFLGTAPLSGATNPPAPVKVSLNAEAAFTNGLVSNGITNFGPHLTNFSKVLKDPDRLNDLFARFTSPIAERSNTFFRIINDLHIKFKAFDSTDSGTDASLGVEYSFDKSLMNHTAGTNWSTPLHLSFNFAASGNIAFDQSANPDDFLDTKLQFHIFQSFGGVDPTILQKDEQQHNFELFQKAAQLKGITPAELDASPEWTAVRNAMVSRLRTQYYYDLAGNGALEANQDFSQKQWVYGVQLGGNIRAWNDDSAWAKFNFLDWPFAALRVLTGADPGWHPSGRALPSVLAGIDLVDPFDNDERLAVDPDTSSYPRFRGEVVFKTKVARLMEKDVWLSAGYRYYKELDASSAIRAADMDDHAYFAASLEFLGAFSLNYSNGKLPLDRRDDQVFALGYSLKF